MSLQVPQRPSIISFELRADRATPPAVQVHLACSIAPTPVNRLARSHRRRASAGCRASSQAPVWRWPYLRQIWAYQIAALQHAARIALWAAPQSIVPFLSDRGLVDGASQRNAGFPRILVAATKEERSVTVFISTGDDLALAGNTVLAFGNKPIHFGLVLVMRHRPDPPLPLAAPLRTQGSSS